MGVGTRVVGMGGDVRWYMAPRGTGPGAPIPTVSHCIATEPTVHHCSPLYTTVHPLYTTVGSTAVPVHHCCTTVGHCTPLLCHCGPLYTTAVPCTPLPSRVHPRVTSPPTPSWATTAGLSPWRFARSAESWS